MLRLVFVFIVLLNLLVEPANALYFNYTEWSALPEVSRTMFMTGAFDSLVSFATDAGGEEAAKHYDHCVVSAHMSNGQLATNILNYAKDKPALHTKPATMAMIKYLIAACGLPSEPTPK